MRIVYDASGMNVCMYVYSGACTPRVGSQQASQNKLIWFTLLCYCCEVETKYLFFIRKAFENCVWVTWPSTWSLFVLLANFRCSLLLSRWLRIPVTNFLIFPSKFFWINQYTLCLSAIAFYFPFLNIFSAKCFRFRFREELGKHEPLFTSFPSVLPTSHVVCCAHKPAFMKQLHEKCLAKRKKIHCTLWFKLLILNKFVRWLRKISHRNWKHQSTDALGTKSAQHSDELTFSVLTKSVLFQLSRACLSTIFIIKVFHTLTPS